MIENTKLYNGHSYSGVMLQACNDGYEQGVKDTHKEMRNNSLAYQSGYLKGKGDSLDDKLQEFAQWLWDNHYLVDEAFTIKLVETYKEQKNEYK